MRLVLRCVATLAIVGAVLSARLLHFWVRDRSGGTDDVVPYVLFGLLLAFVAAMVGAPRIGSRAQIVVSSAAAAVLGLVAGAFLQLLLPETLPRFVILVAALLTFVVLVAVGEVFMRLRLAGTGSVRVAAVLGAEDETALRVDAEDRDGYEREFLLVDVVSRDDVEVDLVAWCDDHDIELLVLGPVAIMDTRIVDQAEKLHLAGVRIRSLDDFYDAWLGRLPLSSLDRVALMADVESLHGSYRTAKRLVDLISASVGIIVFAVLLPIVLIGNLAANRGPLFFRQPRIGKGGNQFSIWKLRTMAPGAEDVSGWTSNEDPRITPFGKLLRRAHLDELPQVFNIFAGQLSMVGPRPEQASYVEELAEKLPFYNARHIVTPGITGWAQVKYRYAASEEDAYVKLQYDLWYLRHESFTTDLKIMWLTIAHLLLGQGR